MLLDILWNTKERTDSTTVETICVSRVHNSLKCNRNVTKQTNPLQVDNLITHESVGILSVPKLMFLQM
jgi:hypothetical protein